MRRAYEPIAGCAGHGAGRDRARRPIFNALRGQPLARPAFAPAEWAISGPEGWGRGKVRRGALALAFMSGLVGWGWMSAAHGAPQPAPLAPSAQPSDSLSPMPSSTTTTLARTTTTVARTTTSTTTQLKPNPTTTVASTTSATQALNVMIAMSNAVKRSAPSNDQPLIAALAPVEALGYTEQQAEVMGMGQFPVAGSATYDDGWLQYRATPTPHNQMGIDIVAALDTPIRAPIAGTVKYVRDTDPDGYGVAADVTGGDGTYYVLGDMSSTVKTVTSGSAVTQGEVIGYVGESGDASQPELYFEVHPQGGSAIDGKPMLDSWQTTAIQAVPALVASLEASTSTTTTVPPPPTSAPRQAALSPPLATKKSSGSLTGLAVIGFVAFALASLALALFRPSRVIPAPAGGRATSGARGPGEPPAGPPTPAR